MATTHDPRTCQNSVPCGDCFDAEHKTPMQNLMAALERNDVDPDDFFEHCGDVNNALNDAGLDNITLDWYSTLEDGAVHVSFFSHKIRRTVMVDSDMTLMQGTIEDMARQLVQYSNEATKLEAFLPEYKN